MQNNIKTSTMSGTYLGASKRIRICMYAKNKNLHTYAFLIIEGKIYNSHTGGSASADTRSRKICDQYAGAQTAICNQFCWHHNWNLCCRLCSVVFLLFPANNARAHHVSGAPIAVPNAVSIPRLETQVDQSFDDLIDIRQVQTEQQHSESVYVYCYCHCYCILFCSIILLRQMFAWYFQRKLNKNGDKLTQLKEMKNKILEQVMDKETYKASTGRATKAVHY